MQKHVAQACAIGGNTIAILRIYDRQTLLDAFHFNVFVYNFLLLRQVLAPSPGRVGCQSFTEPVLSALLYKQTSKKDYF
jgi:hypothetical protein